MLTRLQFRRSQILIVRCLSDKVSNSDDMDVKQKPSNEGEETSKSKESGSSVDKIQELLKSMMQETKIKDDEYRAKFASAPINPRKRKPKEDEIEVKIEKIEESITTAAGEVAQAIGGDVKQTEAELLSRVLGKINQTSTSLSDLILGMKVDRSKEQEEGAPAADRGHQVKRLLERSRLKSQTTKHIPRRDSNFATRYVRDKQSTPQIKTVDLFGEKPLGIFTKKDVPNYGTELEVWEAMQRRELMLATSQPPANYFQKMILWTEQGKVWKFPINNEQGLDEEEKVHFSEHIFLDTLLEEWCPKKGPIRHFMELVCVGLSKNPFYTVQEKRDHIMWYREYFESKKDLLTEVGAWDVQPKSETTETTSS